MNFKFDLRRDFSPETRPGGSECILRSREVLSLRSLRFFRRFYASAQAWLR
ncbi:hypothetical protein [Microviridae sp.]|nr:hypothetical protein [Microviridae sp.]